MENDDESRGGPARFPVAEMRAAEGVSQARFWRRYGVSQSGGSRYETVRSLPRPLLMLIWLHQHRYVSDADLTAALQASRLSRRRRKKRNATALAGGVSRSAISA